MKQKILFPIFLVISFFFMQCKTDDVTPTNIILYNQPLETIQHYIQGKWKFVYGKGGIISNTKYYCDDCFIEFTSQNRVLIPNKVGGYLADTTIEWIRDIGTYTNGEYTYIMKFYDKYGYPNVYVIDKVYDDTLIYHDNSSDAIFYHYIKAY